MAHRFLIGLSIGLVFATLTVPLGRAGEKYDGYKSGFPELRQIREFARTVSPYDGYKSGFPELRRIREFARTVSPYDGYKSSFPELRQIHEFARTHQIVVAKAAPASNPFDWPDAAVGAGTAAVTIFLLAAGVLFVGRRRTRVAV